MAPVVSIRYHGRMAMTLRLNDEQDRLLTELARAQGLSKNDAALRAIEEVASRRAHEEKVRTLADQAITRYGPLLDRLAQ